LSKFSTLALLEQERVYQTHPLKEKKPKRKIVAVPKSYHQLYYLKNREKLIARSFQYRQLHADKRKGDRHKLSRRERYLIEKNKKFCPPFKSIGETDFCPPFKHSKKSNFGIKEIEENDNCPPFKNKFFYEKTWNWLNEKKDSSFLSFPKEALRKAIEKMFSPKERNNLIFLTLTAEPNKFPNELSFRKACNNWIAESKIEKIASIIEPHSDQSRFHMHAILQHLDDCPPNSERERRKNCFNCEAQYKKTWTHGDQGVGVKALSIGSKTDDFYNTLNYSIKDLQKLSDYFQRVRLSNNHQTTYLKELVTYCKSQLEQRRLDNYRVRKRGV
jgi:hypothetical protein